MRIGRAMTKKLKSKRDALLSIGGIGLPPLIIANAFATIMPGYTPVGLLLPFTALYALIVFAICLVSAGASKRPMIRADVLRIICWTVLAAGEGLREMGTGYFMGGWPQYVFLVDSVSISAMVGALALIIISLLLWPPAPVPAMPAHPPPVPRCVRCGYSLRGLTVPRCPECGKPFDRRILQVAPDTPRQSAPSETVTERTEAEGRNRK